MMRSVVLASPYTFDQVEVPAPTADDLAEGQVLLQVRVGGICGSDLPAYRGGLLAALELRMTGTQLPQGAPLHEVVGVVTATRNPRHRIGDRVVGWASEFDALSAVIIADGEQLIAVPDGWSDREAITVQPLACVLYALNMLGSVENNTAAVLGLGPIGLLFSHVLATRGARVVGIDRVSRARVAELYQLHKVETLSVDRWLTTLATEDRPQIVIEAIGHQMSTVSTAISAVAFGGRVFCFGVPDDATYPIPMKELFRKNVTLMAGWTMDRAAMLDQAVAYLNDATELRTAYVTDAYPLEQVGAAFDAACRPRPSQVKVVVEVDADNSHEVEGMTP